MYGFRLENSAGRRSYGIDYSFNKISYTAINEFNKEISEEQYQDRINLSFNRTVFYALRISGYFGAQSGCEFTRKIITLDDLQLYAWEKKHSARLNARIHFGINIYAGINGLEVHQSLIISGIISLV